MKKHIIFILILITNSSAFGIVQADSTQDKPSRLYTKKYTESRSASLQGYQNTTYSVPGWADCWYDYSMDQSINESINYDENGNGSGGYSWVNGYGVMSFLSPRVIDDPNDSLGGWYQTISDSGSIILSNYGAVTIDTEGGSYSTISSAYGSNYTSYSGISTNTIFYGYYAIFTPEHCDIYNPLNNHSSNGTFPYKGPNNEFGSTIYNFQEQYTRQAQATLKFQVGGKAIPNFRRFFSFSPSATYYDSIWSSGTLEIYPPFSSPYSVPQHRVPWAQIGIGSFTNPIYGNVPFNWFGGTIYSPGVIYYESLAAGSDVDVTPYVPGLDCYTFSVNSSEITNKADWQGVVQLEIDANNDVSIENYQATTGFMSNRANIQAVYSFYQQLYTERPTQFYWAGLAKLAGAPVYAGLSDAEYTKNGDITTGVIAIGGAGTIIPLFTLQDLASQFQTNLLSMNIAIYSDLAWQFEAYRRGGLVALENIATSVGNDPNIIDITPWRLLDQGIQANNTSLIQSANQSILQREQEQILAQGYMDLNNLFPGTTSLMSILAQNPVLGGPSFSSMEPYGNIATFSDRWDWITHSYYSTSDSGMFPLWLQEASSTRLLDVSQPLLYRAQNNFSLAYSLFGLPIY